MRNAGNTCFFNSVLQTLTYTPPLQNYLLSKEHSSACRVTSEGGFCALCLFEGHALEVLDGGSSAVHPKAMLRRLRDLGGKAMRLGQQEDAHEFLLHFLDSCHRASLHATGRQGSVPPAVLHTTLIRQLFGGYLRSQVLCLECNFESNTFDPFLDLSLEVRNAASLEKALEAFTKSERLLGPNRYRCKRCKQVVDATKCFSICTLPPLLTFQLKRFEYKQGVKGKIMKPVQFGTMINVGRFTNHPTKEAMYRLYAVIVHDGHSAKSGHYFAFVKHMSGTWYKFDDESVKSVSEPVVLRQQAYLLFYEAASPPALASGQAESSSSAAASVVPGADAMINGYHVNGASERKPLSEASPQSSLAPMTSEGCAAPPRVDHGAGGAQPLPPLHRPRGNRGC